LRRERPQRCCPDAKLIPRIGGTTAPVFPRLRLGFVSRAEANCCPITDDLGRLRPCENSRWFSLGSPMVSKCSMKALGACETGASKPKSENTRWFGYSDTSENKLLETWISA
jgi:hypothetical protein